MARALRVEYSGAFYHVINRRVYSRRCWICKLGQRELFIQPARKKEIPLLRQLNPRQTPDAIVEAVCQEFNCQAEQILRTGAKRNTARDVAIYLARELSGESGVDLGKYFGNISGAGVTGRYKHISKQISRNRRLKGRVNRVKNRIVNNWDASPLFSQFSSFLLLADRICENKLWCRSLLGFSGKTGD